MSGATCQLCGEPMPPGEEMFKFHGYSGPCPKPPLTTPDQRPITVAWLHSIKPKEWKARVRGISYANWTIHSIQSKPVLERDDWDGYDAGPFVWTVAPTHGANMVPLDKPGFFTILVLESRADVLKLLDLLGGQSS